MSGKKLLSTAIMMALTATLFGCGDSSSKKNTVLDNRQPTTGNIQSTQPNINSQNNPQPQSPSQPTQTPNQPQISHQPTVTEKPTQVEADFTPRSSTLVHGSAVRLGKNSGGGQYISNGYSVRPLSHEQKVKAQEMLRLTNNYRQENGLAPLQFDERLTAYAYVRANEIRQKYDHERPNGLKKNSGLSIGRGWKAENLDASQESAEVTFDRWVHSKAHRDNLLNKHVTRIGIAYLYDPNSLRKYHWTQIFVSGDVSTPYHFDENMTGTAVPQMEKHLSNKVALQSGKISLLGGERSDRDNSAVNYQSRQLTHAIYKSARHYVNNGYDAIIQEPTGAFSYQTFGEVVDPSREPVQYLNVGQPTIPEANANFQASYRGASVGNLNRNSHVYADVSAEVNFGQTKTMNLQFSNSRIARNDIANSKPAQPLSSASNLDFTENLQWNSTQGRFNGSTTTANFYGPHGEEIGGQFIRQVSNGVYQGAFGLRKVD